MSHRSMLLTAVLLVSCALPALGPRTSRAEPDAEPAETIAWLHDVVAGFERAAAEKKVLMICINAQHAIGEREEPAAKGLREVVYLDPAVVEKSREFVCVFLTAEGSSEDYGELRYRLGVDGYIVSPQHIFAHPAHEVGTKPLVRKEYWPYGQGEPAVKALLALMDEALSAYRVREGMPDAPSDGEGDDAGGGTAPASGAERAAWIEKLLGLIQGPDADMRRHALGTLAEHDLEGDCISPLIPLLEAFEKDKRVDALVDVVRTLGVPGLEAATPPLHALLAHKDPSVRGNVAVTLEYIGAAASAEPLLARLKKEKEPAIANHVARALGRCGAGDAAAKKKLLREALPGKDDDFGSFGAVIGLAYFAGDAKLARALEKQLLKLGSPLQQGNNAHAFLRAAIVWCLSEIRDPETAPFLRKRVLRPLEDEESPWKGGIVLYYDAVARKCQGSDDVQSDIDRGISWYLWSDNARALADECRRGRNMQKFVPKGEWGNQPAQEDDE